MGTFKYKNKKNTASQLAKLSSTGADKLIQPTIDGIKLVKEAVETKTPDSFECTLDAKIYGKLGSCITWCNYDATDFSKEHFIDRFLRLSLKCKKRSDSEPKTLEYNIRLTKEKCPVQKSEILSTFSDIANSFVDYTDAGCDAQMLGKDTDLRSIYNKLGE